jgi:protein-tyrosine phosphatase
LPFTDLHSHILPGFDDGAGDVGEFVEMAKVAVRGGTAYMAATPHYDLESPAMLLEEVTAAVEDNLQVLRSQDIPLALVPGVEVRINAGLFRLAKEEGNLDRLSLVRAGKFILVDLPLFDLPVAMDDILFQVQLCGIIPILAHPERNRLLVKNTEMIREMVDRGVEMQVNSGSLEGIYGSEARRVAYSLLKEGAARLVASDAHQSRGRSPNLSGAARIITRRMGAEASRILLDVNPGLVLAGQGMVDAVKTSMRRPRPVRSLSWRKSS